MWTVQKGERGRSFEQKRTVQSDSGWSFVKRLLSQSGRSWTVVSHFPTSARAFQLQLELFNFAWLFQTSAILSNFRLSNLKLLNFSFLPTALFNYTYFGFRVHFLFNGLYGILLKCSQIIIR